MLRGALADARRERPVAALGEFTELLGGVPQVRVPHPLRAKERRPDVDQRTTSQASSITVGLPPRASSAHLRASCRVWSGPEVTWVSAGGAAREKPALARRS